MDVSILKGSAGVSARNSLDSAAAVDDMKRKRGVRSEFAGGEAEATMKYKVLLEESEEGFAVSVPALPGCHSQGATEQEALENIADAIREYLEVVTDRLRGEQVREVEIEV
jgi:predicted RNase H-like HicB family nuclease